jgi:tRNA-Thr(GGU) m(6)t(6)A37 methyltransferase TsaA
MKALQPVTIGVVRTPFLEPTGTPIQPRFSEGTQGTISVRDEYAEGLDDIEGFERLWLIYWLDRIPAAKLKIVPYRDTRERGLFATRAPCRPNPIGLSVVRLLRREGSTLHVADVDLLDNTPLLDIKPYIPEYDAYPESRAGWVNETTVSRKVADGRFHK